MENVLILNPDVCKEFSKALTVFDELGLVDHDAEG